MSLGIAFPDPVSSTMRLVKIITVVIVMIIIGVLGFTTHYFYQENKQTLVEKGELKEQLTAVKHDIELMRVGTEAMRLGQSLADKQKTETNTASRQVRDKLKVTEISIDNSTMSVEDKATAKSVARMDSIWSMYCQIQPNNAVCKTVIVPEKTQ